jgi:hypothetical protein
MDSHDLNRPEDNIIVVQSSKEITRLYKTFLEMLEDLYRDNQIMLEKVSSKTSPEFSESINYFNHAKYEQAYS